MTDYVRVTSNSNCSVCGNKIKYGDYLATGKNMKPFCKKCENHIYTNHEPEAIEQNK